MKKPPVEMAPVKLAIDGVRFVLLAPHDFTWLREVGRVFQVFDQQDSGNLCFGVVNGGRRRFIKYAGARTIHHRGEPVTAIARLKHAAQGV